jgi:hypothetical protein
MTTYSTEEGWHVVEDGKKLYTKTWKVGFLLDLHPTADTIAAARTCEGATRVSSRIQ